MPSEFAGEDGSKPFVDAIDGSAVRVNEGRTTVDTKHAERHNEVRQLKLGNHESVNQTADHAQQHSGRYSQKEVVREHAGSDHASKTHHRSYGEVDSPSHDDQGHADCNHRVDRGLQQDVQDVRWLVEAAGKHREDHEKERNAGADTRASDPFKLDALFRAGR